MEFVSFGRFVLSFAVVIGLIGLLALVARRYGTKSLFIKPRDEARLEVLESLPIDPRFRLLIVRRDNVEHLLVRGPESVQVIESGFQSEHSENNISLFPSEPKLFSKG